MELNCNLNTKLASFFKAFSCVLEKIDKMILFCSFFTKTTSSISPSVLGVFVNDERYIVAFAPQVLGKKGKIPVIEIAPLTQFSLGFL